MTPVYVDTGGFIALIWTRDHAHAGMRAAVAGLTSRRARLVTTDAVISETVTRLRYDAGLELTLRFHDLLDQAIAVGQLEVIESSPSVRAAAFDVLATYDGLSLSYADAVGAAVARDIGAEHVLGLDSDFRILGFQLLPAE